jgi:hypothetical protein
MTTYEDSSEGVEDEFPTVSGNSFGKVLPSQAPVSSNIFAKSIEANAQFRA